MTSDSGNVPVRAKAVLVDADGSTVRWMNESAAADLPDGVGDGAGLPVSEAMPAAEMLGVLDALRVVADTGVPQHLQTDLVSTSKGSMRIATSVHRLPDGDLLVLTENTWRPAEKGARGLRGRPRSG